MRYIIFLIFLGIFNFFFANPVILEALTLSQIRAEARYLVNDAQSTRQRYTDTQITSWANEGQKLIDVLSQCQRKRYEFDTIVGTTYYAMPSDFITTMRVKYEDMPLPEVSLAALDKNPTWDTDTGSPLKYFVDFTTRGVIGIYPFPGVATDTETIKVDYIAYSTEMSSDSDEPFDAVNEFDAFHYALVYYCAYKMSIMDENAKDAQLFFQMFGSLVQNMRGVCVNRPNYLPNLMPAGYGKLNTD